MSVYDVIIIGGGPGGAGAAVYAGRKKMKTLLITESFGGQSFVSSRIENWIGAKEITGFDLAKNLEEHARAQETVEIKMPERVIGVKEIDSGFEVETDKNNKHQARTLIVISGGRRRKLKVPGEGEFDGKGVFYCSICDAPLMKDKKAAVVGGGNAGLEAVRDLLPYAVEIYLLNIGEELTGDPVTQAEIKKSPKVKIINNAKTLKILGGKLVSGIKYQDLKTKEVKELSLEGVFVEIGSIPNSEFLKGLVELNERGEVVIDHQTGKTSVPGIFAAGDVTDEMYKQNNIAVGDAIKAVLSSYNYLLSLKKSRN